MLKLDTIRKKKCRSWTLYERRSVEVGHYTKEEVLKILHYTEEEVLKLDTIRKKKCSSWTLYRRRRTVISCDLMKRV